MQKLEEEKVKEVEDTKEEEKVKIPKGGSKIPKKKPVGSHVMSPTEKKSLLANKQPSQFESSSPQLKLTQKKPHVPKCGKKEEPAISGKILKKL